MADPCMIYEPSSTYENVYCSPPQAGILAFQPICQVLPDGRIVNNPCYDSSSNRSYWTYKFFTEYSMDNSICSIDSILIPIYRGIRNTPAGTITVEERMDGSGPFKQIEFALDTSDHNLGFSPSGFQWLRIENPTPPSPPNTKRYNKGVCVEYRISILGDYEASPQPIKIKAGQNNLTFSGADVSFLCPGNPSAGELNVTQTCQTMVANNMAKLHYKITITNTGGQTLYNINYKDTIFYNSEIMTLGNVSIASTHPNLLFSSADKGTIIISGVIPEISGGNGSFSATYDIPVALVTIPGQHSVDNTLIVSVGGSSSSTSCTAIVPVVKLKADKCSTIINGNKASFITRLSSVGASPQTSVSIIEQLVIPAGVTVRFNATSLASSTALYTDTNTPVELNTDITDRTINIIHENVGIPAGNTVQKTIGFNIVSTSAFHTPARIINIIQLVIGRSLNQVFMLPEGLPASASIDVAGCTKCMPECQV